MDSIFDDDTDDVGSDIEAYCPSPRCKADTQHTIISKYEDEVRRVQCVVCGDVHAYRKPRGESLEEGGEPSQRKKTVKKPSWEDAMARTTEKDLDRCRPYSIRDTYVEGDVVSHPTFHVGFVTELLPDNKLEITFRDERRVLVHNRADLATKMPAIAEVPSPRTEKKKGKRATKNELAERWSEPLDGKKTDAREVAAKEATAERAAAAKLAGHTDDGKASGKAGKGGKGGKAVVAAKPDKGVKGAPKPVKGAAPPVKGAAPPMPSKGKPAVAAAKPVPGKPGAAAAARPGAAAAAKPAAKATVATTSAAKPAAKPAVVAKATHKAPVKAAAKQPAKKAAAKRPAARPPARAMRHSAKKAAKPGKSAKKK